MVKFVFFFKSEVQILTYNVGLNGKRCGSLIHGIVNIDSKIPIQVENKEENYENALES